MTPERLRRIRAVYEAAVDTPAAVRQAVLDRECDGDDELRQEVERLLGAHEHLPEWLSGPVLGMAHAALAGEPSTLTQPGPAARMHFPPGTVLAQRYRIIYLLGRGGMGEVYRADDLLLGQPVALKFLPAAGDAALSRFRNEVRTARQVSHPNVCRVYDIGEADGLTYLSMEYVDGEDLASLLRRIGKLPQEKALEIARQICAGLAAAHDKGVIHRDLKPANIMLDGRGDVRITDFGIAGVAAQIRDVGSGTPDYMSPEQLAGKEVTPRSDIYALGIVLCELLTGNRPPLKLSGASSSELDPQVERVIQRCLDPDPKLRPPSALFVSASLPGGDPLAAALARGVTPTPDMVAASQQKEGLEPWTAAGCFTAVLLLLAIFALLFNRGFIVHFAPVEIPAEALAFRAQQVLSELGYREPSKSTAYGFDQVDTSLGLSSLGTYMVYLDRHRSLDRTKLLATQRPAVIGFWYRESQEAFRLDSFPGVISFGDAIEYDSPANSEPGMIRLRLDPRGRLIALEARPSQNSGSSAFRKANSTGSADWSVLFRLADLDQSRFSPAEPVTVPPSAFDSRAAWTGTFGEGRPEQVRLEAASWKGQPVYFAITGDWQQTASSLTGPTRIGLGMGLGAGLFILVPAVSVLLAVRNLRRGRADRKGAWIIAAIAFSLTLSSGFLAAAHVAGLWEEIGILLKALSWSGVAAGLLASLYLAIEPHVRRHWPDALISWSRVRAGRTRDPLVASHILVGISAIMAFEALHFAVIAAGDAALRDWQPFPALLQSLNGSRLFVAVLLRQISYGIFASILLLLAVVLVRKVVRRLWLADLLAAMAFAASTFLIYSNPIQGATAGILNMGFTYLVLWMLRRFGLVAAFAGVITNQVLTMTGPIQLSSWYAGRSLVTLAVPALAAAWALWVVLSSYRGPMASAGRGDNTPASV
jgi:serine/threonine-protein kinase